MKTNRIFVSVRHFVVLTISLLGATSLQAQTYLGTTGLTASPRNLEASIYPVQSRPSTIRVNFNNPTGALVRVVIRDENGKPVYDAVERRTMFRARFDLSPLPTGAYTVELSTKEDRIAQAFTIDPPIQGHLTMKNRSDQKTPDDQPNRGLIVSY